MRNDAVRGFRRTALVAALLASPGDSTHAQDAGDAGGSAAAPVLEAMRALESARDAKCHSSACRFEDFVFGTPLADGGRVAKIELQKRLARRAWNAASSAARARGAPRVSSEEMTRVLSALVRVEVGPDGELSVATPGGEPVTISAVRARQYGSIAYSLRVVLSVQQDQLFGGAEELLPLEEPALGALVGALDAVTLSALMLADADARTRSLAEIDADGFARAWRALVPDPGADGESGPPELAASPASLAEAASVLRGIIREKQAAYERYNDLTPEVRGERFLTNLQSFYALYDVPPDEERTRPLLAAYNRAMVNFALQLMLAAHAIADAKGHVLVRSEDASRAVQLLTPHVVDDLEDVHFFPRLDLAESVTLEAYDCDSYRDLGRHWAYLEMALDHPEAPAAVPDPFAAEIVAEAISQYGVLVLRMAGDVAKTRRAARYLQPNDVQRAVRRIARRARNDREAPEPATRAEGIASAPTLAGRTEGTFFTDATAESGITFMHRSSRWLSEFRRERTAGPPTFSGGGVAAEDLDGDGRPELLFAGGLGNALYESDGQGRFTDVTVAAGLAWRRADGDAGEARVPLLADLDDDGRADVLITYANDAHRVYRNLGGMRFEDETEAAGLGGEALVGGPATIFDFDGDGLLDVYVCYFGNYLAGEIPTIDRDNRNGLPNQLFRNQGGMRFENVTPGSGADDTGWCQAVSHTDLDRDGRQDIVVANDFGRNALLRNLGEGKFENVAPALGITEAYHSMNVGISDLNGDDFPDIYVSNIATLVKDNKYVLPDVNTPLDFRYGSMATMLVKESDRLYMSRAERGKLLRYEPSTEVERGATSTGWAWDAEFLDFDHDGDDDLYVVNGTNDYNFYSSIHPLENEKGETAHVYLSHARESNVFFVNEGGKLRNRSARSGADLLLNSRSAAYLDIDEDGDLDIAVNNFHSAAVLLRNDRGAGSGGWAQVRLVGDPERGVNRDAIGARLVATTAAGVRVSREVEGGSGYFSCNPKTQHLGLGSADSFDLHVVWPDGETQDLHGLGANRRYVLRQGEALPDGAR